LPFCQLRIDGRGGISGLRDVELRERDGLAGGRSCVPGDTRAVLRKIGNADSIVAFRINGEEGFFADDGRLLGPRERRVGPLARGSLWDTDEDHVPVMARPASPLAVARDPLLLGSGVYPTVDDGVGHPAAARPALFGPITYRRVQLVIRDHVESLAILFSPTGFHAIFGIPMSPLSDLGVEGDGVLGPEVAALNERLSNAKSFFERTEMLDNFLINQLRRRPILDITGVAFEGLTAAGLPATAAELARQTGLSLRQLELKTLEYAGVSPKMLIRIARFKKAL
jgi:hypothetical protein